MEIFYKLCFFQWKKFFGTNIAKLKGKKNPSNFWGSAPKKSFAKKNFAEKVEAIFNTGNKKYILFLLKFLKISSTL